MAIQTNEQTTFGMTGIRESLKDVVYRISPEETPFLSNLQAGEKPKTTYHEWQTQTLTAASKSNRVLEGDDNFTAGAAVARTRVGNYCQISRKSGAVSGTAEAVSVAGVANELDHQKLIKGIELKRDMNVALADNNAQAAGGTATVRACAGVAAWISNAQYGAGTLYTAATADGTDAHNMASLTSSALSLTAMNAAMQAAYIDGGKPTIGFLSPRNKTTFSNLSLASSLGGGADIRYNLNTVRPGALIGTVDSWLSNFGLVDIVCDVQFASDSGTTNGLDDMFLLIDTRYVALSELRPMFSEDLAKNGDNTKFEVLSEYTLEVRAPTAHAAVFAIT